MLYAIRQKLSEAFPRRARRSAPRHPRGRRLRFEGLERRSMLSAAVAAGVVAGGTLNPVSNGSFEIPALTAGSFQYDPAGASWNFIGGAGIATNASGFTSGNPGAPDGSQVAFLQNSGTMTQSVYLNVGAYAITFQAAQRGNSQAHWQQLYISIDGDSVGYATPSSTNYAQYQTANYQVTTAGMHTILIKGVNPQGGDNTALVDNVAIVDTANTIADGSFEAPGLTDKSYQYGADGSPWQFSGSAVSSNGSGFTSNNPGAPAGTQVGVLQGYSSISQSVYLDAGTYSISFQAAQRATHEAHPQEIGIVLDGKRVDTITPVGIQYASYQTASFPVAASGMHTISFNGLNPLGGDCTVFLDNITIAPTNAVNDNSFESPILAVGAFQYDPVGTAWTFAGTAGIASNGSGFTSANPNAPSGAQVAFLQMAGSMTQSVYLSPGAYAIAFQAAQRGVCQASYQQLSIAVDGNNVAYATPSGTAYGSYQTTSFFITTAGMHTIFFKGLNPQGGDNTVLVDNVTIVTTANVISDGDFEMPALALGDFRYDVDGSPWQFTGAAGVASNGSKFTNPPAPNGTQAAFVQNAGRMSQWVYFDPGSYAIALEAAQRVLNQALSQQEVGVLVDGVQVGTITPTSSTYLPYQTPSFSITTAGMHSIQFVGLNPQGGDNTAFLDAISLANANPISDGDFETPALPAGTFQYEPAGSLWQFGGAAGIASNGSQITAGGPTAPSGTQVAFLQGTGSMSQSVYLDIGNYDLSFMVAQLTGQAANQQIKVLIDGVQNDIFTPTGTQYSLQHTPTFSITTPGAHTIEFVGTDPQGAGSIALFDNVQITSA